MCWPVCLRHEIQGQGSCTCLRRQPPPSLMVLKKGVLHPPPPPGTTYFHMHCLLPCLQFSYHKELASPWGTPFFVLWLLNCCRHGDFGGMYALLPCLQSCMFCPTLETLVYRNGFLSCHVTSPISRSMSLLPGWHAQFTPLRCRLVVKKVMQNFLEVFVLKDTPYRPIQEKMVLQNVPGKKCAVGASCLAM